MKIFNLRARRPIPVWQSVEIPGIRLKADAAPARVRRHPSMMCEAEKSLLYLLARDAYTAEGAIVDAGLFMGASTVAFASGLRRNRATRRYAHGKPIQSYDIALWVEGMAKYFSGRESEFEDILARWRPRPGESFEPLLRFFISGTEDLVELHVGDIVETARSDVPIEIAFYDCLKTSQRDKAVFKAFAPHYIVGKTTVIQQDYFYQRAAHHRIRQEFLAPYFTYLGSIRTSAVFRLSSPIPAAYFADDPVDHLDAERKLALLEQAARRTPSLRLSLLTRLATVKFALEESGWERARDLLGEIQSVMAHSDPASISGGPSREVAVLSRTLEQRARRDDGRRRQAARNPDTER